jgi:flagellar hook-basal body complex protein FliE
MSQMAIDQVLSQIRALQSAQQAATARPAAAANAAGGTSFADVLKRGLDQVNQAQTGADKLVDAFERGTPGVDLGKVMVEVQKANVAFRATTEARNRFVAAYQEIMNMAI